MLESSKKQMFRLGYVAAGFLALIAVIMGYLARGAADSPSVAAYYSSFESRIGYWLLLGNTRHCGLYEKGALSPFPITKAQRKMEEKLYTRLGLGSGKLLDASAGSGYVAMYMAFKGFDVQAIDITPHHLQDARKNVKANGLESKVAVDYGDYHNLTSFAPEPFDGIYTMETFVHADNPEKVLSNFYRLLKPGGVLGLHEADFSRNSEKLQDVLRLSHCQNTLEEGGYERLLSKGGFNEYSIEDLTDEVLPMWRLFGIVGYVPYQIFKVFGIENRFINVMAGVEVWLNWGNGRYISVRAIKP